jgi:hypothetical protein
VLNYNVFFCVTMLGYTFYVCWCVSENFRVVVISWFEQVRRVKSGAAVICCILLVTFHIFMSACSVF